MSNIPRTGLLVGLSLSFCLRDLINGTVDPARVKKIRCNTAAPDRETFVQIVEHYGHGYWRGNAELAKELALSFWDRGMIDQPRLRDEPCADLREPIYWLGEDERMPNPWDHLAIPTRGIYHRLLPAGGIHGYT